MCIRDSSERNFATFASSRFNYAGLVLHLPLQMRQGLNFLAALTLTVQKKFDLIEVGMYPDRNEVMPEPKVCRPP